MISGISQEQVSRRVKTHLAPKLRVEVLQLLHLLRGLLLDALHKLGAVNAEGLRNEACNV